MRIYGQQTCKVDTKGRLRLPSFLSAHLAKSGDLTLILKGQLDCLQVYTVDSWEKHVSQYDHLSDAVADNITFKRLLFHDVFEVKIDQQQRVNLPSRLLEKASIKSDAAVMGMGGKAEIWNPDRYKAYILEEEKRYNELASQLSNQSNV